MSDRESAFLKVVEAVADGTPVDWEQEVREQRELAAKLDRLKLVEAIGAAHRIPYVSAEYEALPTTKSCEEVDGERYRSDRWGPLEIRERIAAGGFGEVLRAHDPSLQRDVALKLLFPRLGRAGTDDEQFLDEARKLARVRHPNVLVVHGVDAHEGRVGLWTDLIEGMTLEQSLRLQGPLGPDEACHMGIDLCRALAAVHGVGLVHGDVKTANVMRERGGRIVLMDFSSVSERGLRHEAGKNSVSGTPVYMAPELFRGESASVASDLYSLGVVLYRLVTGRFPVQAAGILELRDKHEKGESIPLRDVRPDLPMRYVRAVERALNADPAQRYRSAGEMERALVDALDAAPDATPAKAPAFWLRPGVVMAASALVVVAVVLVVLFSPLFKPLQVDARLFRIGDNTEERLLQGGDVHPGDHLFMEIDGTKEMHVYVLNEDSQGESFLLFPLPSLDQENPLNAESSHRLPGPVAGTDNYWVISSIGGVESVWVIASTEPLHELEAELEGIPQAGPGVPRELDTPSLAPLLRGIGGLSPRESSSAAASRRPLSTILEGFSETTGDRGVWIRELRLTNAGKQTKYEQSKSRLDLEAKR